jgi:diguanylate cyclase (GGDEF)-like protein/PAS domain S-box-containing protein
MKKHLFLFCLFSAVSHICTNAYASVERHALESKATNEPDAVLRELPAAIDDATARKDWRTLSQLHLAQANACRVLADWNCQQAAALAAERFAIEALQPMLQIRALIAQSRSKAALQDFAGAESTLAQTELLLQQHPDADLLAEVMLAYSSVSFQVGRFQSSLSYTDRGIALFQSANGAKAATERGTQVRLLRNQARAQIELAHPDDARQSLTNAINLNATDEDLKLAGELYLEIARLDRKLKNLDQQVINTAKVVALSQRLPNSQLKGQALEVEGLTLLDLGRDADGLRVLNDAYRAFDSLKLRRDALRVLRQLLPLAIRLQQKQEVINQLSLDWIDLQQKVDQEDKTLAAANFDSRLEYAKREFELQQLSQQNKILAANEVLLRKNRNLALAVAVLGFCLALGAIIFALLQMRARRSLHESAQKLVSITENIPAEIAQLDRNYQYLFVNNRTSQLAGLSQKELIGKSFLSIHPQLARQRKIMADRALQGETVRFEEHVAQEDSLATDDLATSFETVFVPDYAQDGGHLTKGFFAVRFDISRLKQAERELAKIAGQDSLTGLSNRRHFNKQLELAIERARKDGTAISLLALDVDWFKSVNDSYGHLIGDEKLIQVASAISESIRQTDAAARVGGDEFLVLLERTPNIDAAMQVAEKIRERVAQLNEGAGTAVTLSIGVTHCEKPTSADELLAPADEALYAAKHAGRNTVKAKQSP